MIFKTSMNCCWILPLNETGTHGRMLKEICDIHFGISYQWMTHQCWGICRSVLLFCVCIFGNKHIFSNVYILICGIVRKKKSTSLQKLIWAWLFTIVIGITSWKLISPEGKKKKGNLRNRICLKCQTDGDASSEKFLNCIPKRAQPRFPSPSG